MQFKLSTGYIVCRTVKNPEFTYDSYLSKFSTEITVYNIRTNGYKKSRGVPNRVNSISTLCGLFCPHQYWISCCIMCIIYTISRSMKSSNWTFSYHLKIIKFLLNHGKPIKYTIKIILLVKNVDFLLERRRESRAGLVI